MGAEQRKNIRFLVENNVIAALRNGFTKIGKVKDISIGGFSFEHIYDENSNWESSKKDVFLWVNEFSMSKVPCRIVYEIPVHTPPEYASLPIHFMARRCGAQFEPLSEVQITQLDFFLKNFTKGPSS